MRSKILIESFLDQINQLLDSVFVLKLYTLRENTIQSKNHIKWNRIK